MKEELIKAFKQIYNEEEIINVMYVESKQIAYIECRSGYAYKVEYNNGNIETTYINY